MTEEVENVEYPVDAREHSPFGFSRQPLLDKCPGFLAREADDNAAAARGTRLGEQIAQWVLDGFGSGDPLPDEDAGALAYAREVLSEWKDPDYQWHAELAIYTEIQDLWGYADLVGLDRHGEKDIILVELKSGWSERPRAWRNPQVMGLALGLLETGGPPVTAILIEVDKRSYSVAMWDSSDIRRLRSTLASIIAAAREPSESALEAGAWCTWCDRHGYCPAFATAPGKALTALRRPVQPPAEWAGGLSPDLVAEILDRAKPAVELANDYLGALKARAMTLLEAGAEVPGWRIKTTAGARQWVDAEAAQDELEPILGPVIMALKSPAQIEAIARADGVKQEMATIIAQHARSTERRTLTTDRSK